MRFYLGLIIVALGALLAVASEVGNPADGALEAHDIDIEGALLDLASEVGNATDDALEARGVVVDRPNAPPPLWPLWLPTKGARCRKYDDNRTLRNWYRININEVEDTKLCVRIMKEFEKSFRCANIRPKKYEMTEEYCKIMRPRQLRLTFHGFTTCSKRRVEKAFRKATPNVPGPKVCQRVYTKEAFDKDIYF